VGGVTSKTGGIILIERDQVSPSVKGKNRIFYWIAGLN
jgi:hypothetical protein